MNDLRIRIEKRAQSIAILLMLVCISAQVLAQIPKRMGPGAAEDIKKAFIVVEANLDSLKAHQKYMYEMGYSNPALLTQYDLWMKKYPKNVNIPLAIGTIYHNAEMPQAKDFLLKAAAMDPENAKVWAMLSADAGRWGQEDLAAEYITKATLADPSNAVYAYGLLATFENGDRNAFEKKVFDFAQQFPENDLGGQALYWLGEHSTNLHDKIRCLEALRELYPPEKFVKTTFRLRGLADAYLQTNPEKALLLINEVGNDTDWTSRKEVAESLIRADKLEQEQNYKAAIIELDRMKLPGFNYIDDFITLKKASLQEKAGGVREAYDGLSVKFAKRPSDPLHDALELYGNKIGKDKVHIVEDIERIRNSTATAAYPFELGLYTSNGTLRLDELKGKVILLTFWFPGCGPCKAEFPHFQAVVDSFKGDSLVYLGINVFPSQDGYVIPFIKNNKYSFIPLRGDPTFASQNYGVYSQPTNFLIDKDGKIIFKNFRIDNRNRRTLKLMISSLLEKGPEK